MAATGTATARARHKSMRAAKWDELEAALALVRAQGLLAGRRGHTLRARVPAALVAAAKRKAGVASDTRLVETALAALVARDDYAAWLISQRSTVAPDLDLEF